MIPNAELVNNKAEPSTLCDGDSRCANVDVDVRDGEGLTEEMVEYVAKTAKAELFKCSGE
jgi:hypothetical protein